MSPIFGYVMLFMIWILFAALIWTVAGILSIRRRTRPIGRRLFLAMTGTFPGVLVCQVAAAPIITAVLAAAWLFWRIVEPEATSTTSSAAVAAVSFTAALFVGCFLGLMSLIGFYEGWRIGWAYGSGRQLGKVALSNLPSPFDGSERCLEESKVEHSVTGFSEPFSEFSTSSR